MAHLQQNPRCMDRGILGISWRRLHQSANEPWAHTADGGKAPETPPVTSLNGYAGLRSSLSTSMTVPSRNLRDTDANVAATVSI